MQDTRTPGSRSKPRGFILNSRKCSQNSDQVGRVRTGNKSKVKRPKTGQKQATNVHQTVVVAKQKQAVSSEGGGLCSRLVRETVQGGVLGIEQMTEIVQVDAWWDDRDRLWGLPMTPGGLQQKPK